MKKLKIFYGWYIVAASLVINFFGAGIAVYSFGLFATPLLEEFSWERGELYLAATISTVVGGFSGPFVGKWIDRHGVKPFMPVCAFMAGLLLAALALTQSLWYLYVMYFFMTIARAGISTVPINTMLSNWFEKKRGMALGIVETGISWGGMILTPLAALIIINLGWRPAYAILGIATIVLTVPLVTFVMRLKPEEMGQLPDGRNLNASDDTQSPSIPEGQKQILQPAWTLRTAYKELIFWLLILIFFLFRFAMSGVLYHVIPFWVDEGISSTVASSMISCIAGFAIVGKLAGGYVADRVGPRAVAVFACLLHAMAISILLVFNIMPMYWLFAILFGFSFGAMSPVLAMLVAQCFGRQSFGTIYGTISISITAGIGIGPLFSAYIFDSTGSYNFAFLTVISLLVAASILVLWARAPRPRAVSST